MSRILIQDGSGRVLLEQTLPAERLGERLRGLIGRRGLPPRTGMLLRPCRSIHMWCMRFPIDAAFLDRELQVLKVVRGLRPWRIAWAPLRTACVLETAVGELDAVAVGDRLTED